MKFMGRFGKGRHCRRQMAEQECLREGKSYKIMGYRGRNCAFRRKLLNLGLLRGEQFRVMGKAPLGDPIEIKINGYRLSIRAGEAEELITEQLQNEE